jgi:hypothetical protein
MRDLPLTTRLAIAKLYTRYRSFRKMETIARAQNALGAPCRLATEKRTIEGWNALQAVRTTVYDAAERIDEEHAPEMARLKSELRAAGRNNYQLQRMAAPIAANNIALRDMGREIVKTIDAKPDATALDADFAERIRIQLANSKDD